MALSLVKSYSLPPIDKREVLRYAGVRSSIGESAELISRLDEAIALIKPKTFSLEEALEFIKDMEEDEDEKAMAYFNSLSEEEQRAILDEIAQEKE